MLNPPYSISSRLVCFCVFVCNPSLVVMADWNPPKKTGSGTIVSERAILISPKFCIMINFRMTCLLGSTVKGSFWLQNSKLISKFSFKFSHCHLDTCIPPWSTANFCPLTKKQVHSWRIMTLVFASSGNVTLASSDAYFAQFSAAAPLSPSIPVSAVSEAHAVSMESALLEHYGPPLPNRGSFSRQWLLMAW